MTNIKAAKDEEGSSGCSGAIAGVLASSDCSAVFQPNYFQSNQEKSLKVMLGFSAVVMMIIGWLHSKVSCPAIDAAGPVK